MTDITVRVAGRIDVPTLVAYQVAMARESEDTGLDIDTLTGGVQAAIDDPEKAIYLVAEIDSMTVGSLMITWEWSDWRNGRFWWIQSVYVEPPHRRKGVYRALHERVRKLAEDDPDACGTRLYVERDNTGAIRTYESMGMFETAYRLFEEPIDRS